jgi:hypothetical protein
MLGQRLGAALSWLRAITSQPAARPSSFICNPMLRREEAKNGSGNVAPPGTKSVWPLFVIENSFIISHYMTLPPIATRHASCGYE